MNHLERDELRFWAFWAAFVVVAWQLGWLS